jgi:hypothetical protein
VLPFISPHPSVLHTSTFNTRHVYIANFGFDLRNRPPRRLLAFVS